jgi:hypothetical protein
MPPPAPRPPSRPWPSPSDPATTATEGLPAVSAPGGLRLAPPAPALLPRPTRPTGGRPPTPTGRTRPAAGVGGPPPVAGLPGRRTTQPPDLPGRRRHPVVVPVGHRICLAGGLVRPLGPVDLWDLLGCRSRPAAGAFRPSDPSDPSDPPDCRTRSPRRIGQTTSPVRPPARSVGREVCRSPDAPGRGTCRIRPVVASVRSPGSAQSSGPAPRPIRSAAGSARPSDLPARRIRPSVGPVLPLDPSGHPATRPRGRPADLLAARSAGRRMRPVVGPLDPSGCRQSCPAARAVPLSRPVGRRSRWAARTCADRISPGFPGRWTDLPGTTGSPRLPEPLQCSEAYGITG